MKQINIFRSKALAGTCICLLLLQACKKDGFLDVQNSSAVSSQTAFSTAAAADLVLNDVYNNLPNMYNFNFDPFENWSDNAMTGFSWNLTCNIIRTKANINSQTSFNYTWDGASQWIEWSGDWGGNGVGLYNNVRKCNVYIAGVNASSLPDDYKKKRLGEARTIRAYFYTLLWTLYGGVPIITEPDDRATQGDAIFHLRASSDETFAFIDNELDAASQLLPSDNSGDAKGRVTLGAALTIKGWAELYYASPLLNPGNDKARWTKAAATNQQVMALGYSLYPKYDELFFTTGSTNNEGIFIRQYIPSIKGSSISGFQGPSYIGTTWISWGGSTPTQELVDDYAMANGKAITDPGSGYTDNNPYANREPRFYQSILFNGNTLDGVPYYSYVGSGLNQIDLADAQDQTNTGYCTKKRMDTTVNIFQNGYSGQTYYYFRYAEVLLNYAEAQNEAVGPDETVYAAIDQIRNRAGVPNFTTVYPNVSQDSMRSLIRRERRIELAFEDKRYFDLLRWKIAEVNLNHVMHGMKVTGTPGNFTYTRINVVPPISAQWSFDKTKNYLLPIPLNAIGQNASLTQNPNYQ